MPQLVKVVLLDGQYRDLEITIRATADGSAPPAIFLETLVEPGVDEPAHQPERARRLPHTEYVLSGSRGDLPGYRVKVD